ncbi:hypothetical protein COCMIDRAFT_110305 [Bipolaris oryzae ATCC 44560]|uniref:Uncharacterized protein n=1 Tax=Bipolaris oryzae ATCC 44560 TaxID=930090 RepID=W6Z859_COCMI|nr:uncharacterized protein COCMIDRAFT_110305 [Bipolaris oryzae ATCC 44560]EUC39876.1 hypothetical protein COCMIDRAFT_110305 [Bipolaris oryzae ATCC 44560]
MAERIQQQQSGEQNREWVPSARSIQYYSRIANALFPPSYSTDDSDTPTWEDGLREIEAFNWLGSDEEDVHNKGEASPPEANLTPNPATVVEEYAPTDPAQELDHLSAQTTTTPVPPPGILEPTPVYEPANPVHRLESYLDTQSHSSTPIRPTTPPYQSPCEDPVETTQNAQPPRTLEYLQTFRYSPALETIREKKVPGDEVLVEMLYNTVVFDPSSTSSDPTQDDPNQLQEHFNNMKIREQGNPPPTTPPRPIPATIPFAPKKIQKYKVDLRSKAAIAGAAAAHRTTAPLPPIALFPKTLPKDKVNVRTKAIKAATEKATPEYRNKRVKTDNDDSRPKATASSSPTRKPRIRWTPLSTEDKPDSSPESPFMPAGVKPEYAPRLFASLRRYQKGPSADEGGDASKDANEK